MVQNLLIFQLLFLPLVCAESAVKISTGNRVLRKIGPKFLSLGLDSSMVRGKWCRIDWNKAIILGRELSPAYLRFGGNDADRMWYISTNQSRARDTGANNCDKAGGAKHTNFSMSVDDWTRLNWFCQSSGWSLIFDFNVLIRDKLDKWDPSNAIKLLNYSNMMDYELGFELGNEPTDLKKWYGHEVTAQMLAQDYKKLREVLTVYPKYSQTFVIGPSGTQPSKKRRIQYFRDFFENGGLSQVNAVSFHQYYTNGRTATLNNFRDPELLDELIPEIKLMVNMSKNYSKRAHFPVWLGETASTYGGGTPGLSDAYAAGFMWLDKLGVGALYGLDVIIRQSFYHGAYGLLDENTDPNPDYWLSVLYKRIVGSKVIDCKLKLATSVEKLIRFYCHCGKGRVTIYGMNLGNETVRLTVGDFSGLVDQYLLEPKDGDLRSKTVLLNDRELNFDGTKIPAFLPPTQVSQPLLPGNRFAFYSYPTKLRILLLDEHTVLPLISAYAIAKALNRVHSVSTHYIVRSNI